MKGSGIVPPEPEMGIKMDNYVSMFERRSEDDETVSAVKKPLDEDSELERDRVNETTRDLADIAKQQLEISEEERREAQFAEEEKKRLNSDLFLAEKGLKTIDEAVKKLENMRA